MGIRWRVIDMAHDNSPVNLTCPTIDNIISKIEEIRSMNSDLRVWGNEQYDRAEALENDLCTAQAKLDDAQFEIKELSTKISELEKELDRARSQEVEV